MTLEGCVVRMADTVAYIGRDIEDAILLKLIRRSDIPKLCSEQLGTSNGEIVYTLVTDLISNSFIPADNNREKAISDFPTKFPTSLRN